ANSRCKATTAPAGRQGWHRFDNGQAECGACRLQSWRQAYRNCAAVRDFTVRYQEGACHRGAGPKVRSLTVAAAASHPMGTKLSSKSEGVAGAAPVFASAASAIFS